MLFELLFLLMMLLLLLRILAVCGDVSFRRCFRIKLLEKREIYFIIFRMPSSMFLKYSVDVMPLGSNCKTFYA